MTAPIASRAGFLRTTGERACGAATAGHAGPLACLPGVAGHRYSCGFPVCHRGRSAARDLSARDRDAVAVVSLRDELDLLGGRAAALLPPGSRPAAQHCPEESR